VVPVLGRPGQGASQVEKSPLLNWATQIFLLWHTVKLALSNTGNMSAETEPISQQRGYSKTKIVNSMNSVIKTSRLQ
jgi:hypothetical protein